MPTKKKDFRSGKNQLGNPPEITDKQTENIINGQVDIKLGQFAEGKKSVLKKMKSIKAAGLDVIPFIVWKAKKFDDILLELCNTMYKQITIEKWPKGCIMKGNLGITKNYRSITLTAIATNVYNILLLNCIWSEVKKILRKSIFVYNLY